MCDSMNFPDTVDEFMETYKIVDSEQVYTNGAELVPIFRMKQWFEHIQPTSYVVPVVHGKWIPAPPDGFVCSICRTGYKNQPTLMGKPMFEYCPVCGAKMEGVEDE